MDDTDQRKHSRPAPANCPTDSSGSRLLHEVIKNSNVSGSDYSVFTKDVSETVAQNYGAHSHIYGEGHTHRQASTGNSKRHQHGIALLRNVGEDGISTMDMVAFCRSTQSCRKIPMFNFCSDAKTENRGERVTGVVLVTSTSSSSHSGITLTAEGVVSLSHTPRGLASFEAIAEHIHPHVMFSVVLRLAPKGDSVPAGTIELPFAFDLVPDTKQRPLVETYQGVFLQSRYTASAVMQHTFGKTASEPVPMLVVCPGQAMPESGSLTVDSGIEFAMSTSNLQKGRYVGGERVPNFKIEGMIDKRNNDIDVPLNGRVQVCYCDTAITSIEIQLIRVESCATKQGVVREATEIQNIQIGDGDVPKGMDIPIYMFFPRWYTCPVIKTPSIRVEFEVNLVVTLEGENQLTQNLPFKLYRSVN